MPEDLAVIAALDEREYNRQKGEFVRDFLAAGEKKQQQRQRAFLELVARAKAAKEEDSG